MTKVAVVHEDDSILVVHKPPGLAVHGGAGEKNHTLISLLEAAYPEAIVRLHLVHRLDKATTGVMVIAKDPKTARTLAASWDSTEKNYLALVFGTVTDPRTIARPLTDKHGRTASALTSVTPMAQDSDATVTLLRVTIHTGRTHQIRRHLADEEHPIVLDDKYGDFAANKAFVRTLRSRDVSRPRHLFLMAKSLGLPDGRRFEAPLPPAWRQGLEALSIAVDELGIVS